MTLKTIFAVLREVRKITAEKRIAKIDSDERAAIAKAFNDRYVYRIAYSSDTKYVWMCPECNRIHASYGWDGFTGPQFPGCCMTPKGPRIYENIRTQ